MYYLVKVHARRDRRRTVELEQKRYLLMRFWNIDVLQSLDDVCETILRSLQGEG